MVSVEDVVRALVKADGLIKRDRGSGRAVLRRSEFEPVTVWFRGREGRCRSYRSP